ncbi:MAG: hypothetical protein H6741_34245, partial [Alphaproteobacteria bacterium]|nr:hypothetical protein [Alphaproteobacteria bacterium]
MIPLLLALACSTPAPPAPAPPPAPEAPELRAVAVGDCWVMPLPVAVGLQLGPDGRALVTSQDAAAGREHSSSWWVDPATGLLEPLGEGLGPLPQVLSDGSVLLSRPEPLAPDTSWETVHLGQRPEEVTRLVRLADGAETPLSTPGHDVTSFLPLESEGALLYVAGRRLWRVPLSGGTPEAVASEILDIHDVLEDGRWLVDTVYEERLAMALVGPEGVEQAYGEGVDQAMVRDGEVLAQSHFLGPLQRGPLAGPLETLPADTPRWLLPGGAVATLASDGVQLAFLGEAGEGLHVAGAAGLRDARRQGDQVLALALHNTLQQGTVSPLSEADLCVLPASGRASVTPRDVPFRYVARFADLEALGAELQAKVESYAVRGVGGLVELSLDGPGPVRPQSMQELADRARAAMPGPAPDLMLRFPDSGR